MHDSQSKQAIKQALQGFATGSLLENALVLFQVLGYQSDKREELSPNTPENFVDTFDQYGTLNSQNALLSAWQSVDLLFQLTGDEITSSSQGRFVFDTNQKVDNTIIESYLFFAIGLRGTAYTRTQLSGITREINKLFRMPVMVLFKHGQTLTLSIINRRLHKQDESKDVLEKVTLIKDINYADPHRAHIEILFDLSLEQLHQQYGFTNFVELHRAWQSTLDSSELNKRFFREVANWYFWAIQQVTFPQDAGPDIDIRNATSVIRLITRLIFIWFLKEKGLAPDTLFHPRKLRDIITSLDPQESTYYKAILQNLFFATLNQEMNTPEKPDNRKFRGEGRQHYNITSLYRYKRYFQQPDEALCLFETIPFLNGGLFECLDKPDKDDPKKIVRIDGFSDRDDNELAIPNFLFFSQEREVDLNAAYGTTNKRYKVRGLIDIFASYKFTINENTPIEEEIALDPELLGRVFENLLAAYNPETGATARKQTGSFYTPREIVHYMVDESLIAYLESKLTETGNYGDEGQQRELNDRLRHLLAYNDEPHRFGEPEVASLIEAIDTVKILDPACGSGAFPMGILHKLVFILSKLDPQNKRWKEKQIAKASEIPDSTIREKVFADIEEAFERNELDYGRKLYLIENCIYGVDIQPIAVQIAKLRFFISLIVDQKIDDRQENRGILPLPNLETKFVAANALIGIEKPTQLMLRDPVIEQKEKELAEVRRQHFIARTPKTKAKYRELDAKLRVEISGLLRNSGFPGVTAEKLAHWDPYDQNASAVFFDAEWMFGVSNGFDVVIGNPPYVRQEQIRELKPSLQRQYTCYTGVADLYVYFYDRGLQLLREGGLLTYISSNKYFRSGYGEKLRRFLSNQATIHQLIDFGDAPVFTAISYPSIIILRKVSSNDNNQILTLTWEPGSPIEEFASVFRADSFLIAQRELTADGWRLELPSVLRLLEKLRHTGKPLGEYVNGRFYRGILTGLNEAFVVDRTTRDYLIAEHPSSAEILKPFLRGRDVKRWRIEDSGLYLCYIGWELPIQKYPALYTHLKKFETDLKARPEVKQGRVPWYALSRYASEYWQEFEQPKIVYPNICKRNEFAWDENGYYTNQKAFIIPRASKYLLGVLNSNVVMWLFSKLLAKLQNDFYEPSAIFIKDFPIPNATPEQQEPIIKLVDQILAAKRADPAADVSDLEQEIDQLVYQLYGLTLEEMAIVEEATQLK